MNLVRHMLFCLPFFLFGSAFAQDVLPEDQDDVYDLDLEYVEGEGPEYSWPEPWQPLRTWTTSCSLSTNQEAQVIVIPRDEEPSQEIVCPPDSDVVCCYPIDLVWVEYEWQEEEVLDY